MGSRTAPVVTTPTLVQHTEVTMRSGILFTLLIGLCAAAVPRSRSKNGGKQQSISRSLDIETRGWWDHFKGAAKDWWKNGGKQKTISTVASWLERAEHQKRDLIDDMFDGIHKQLGDKSRSMDIETRGWWDHFKGAAKDWWKNGGKQKTISTVASWLERAEHQKRDLIDDMFDGIHKQLGDKS